MQSVFTNFGASLVAQWLKKKKKKHLSMQEIQVQSLVWEEPLEEEMATHLSILAWDLKSHEHRSLAGSSPWGRKELDTT